MITYNICSRNVCPSLPPNLWLRSDKFVLYVQESGNHFVLSLLEVLIVTTVIYVSVVYQSNSQCNTKELRRNNKILRV